MIDKNRLEQKCSTWNIALTGTQLDQLDAFAEILVEYNQKVNLTAITDPEGIEDKHFLDSLLFASQPEVAGKMVDVGAGAGFPGIVTKIFKPELELTLMEPTGKRVEFLKYGSDHAGRILPAAGEGGRKLPCHEGRFRRRRAGRSPGRHQEAGRRVQRDPHPPSSGRRYPHSHPLQKDFANSDCLPQKRRKNCEKSAEITEHRIENARPCRTNLLAGSFIFW